MEMNGSPDARLAKFPYSEPTQASEKPSLIDAALDSVDLRLVIQSSLSREGSKSDTYLAEWELLKNADEDVKTILKSYGQPRVVIKLPKRLPNLQEISQQNRLARISYMQTIESHSSRKLTTLGRRVARVLYSERFRCTIDGQSVRLPVILQEHVDGVTLHEFVAKHFAAGDHQFRGISSHGQLYDYARDITELVQQVHRAQVVHGDISSRNLMVRLGPAEAPFAERLCIIDFGEAVFRDEKGLGAMGSLGMLYERLEKVSEAYDIRQLGLIFAFLAAGEVDSLDQEIRYLRSAAERRDRIFQFIVRTNPGLAHECPGVAEVISACVSPEIGERPKTAADVLSLLKIFVDHPVRSSLLGSAPPFPTTSESHARGILEGILAVEKMRLASRTEDLESGVQHVYGGRHKIELGLCSILGGLQAGDRYMTLSHPGFWSEANLRMRGPYFTMNRVALRRGAIINRIFLVSEADFSDAAARFRLETLLRAHEQLADEFNAGGTSLYKLKVLPLSEDYRRRLIDDGNNFGLMVIPAGAAASSVVSAPPKASSEDSYITASLHYDGARIVGVTFNAAPELGKEVESRFRYFDHKSGAITVAQYLSGLGGNDSPGL